MKESNPIRIATALRTAALAVTVLISLVALACGTPAEQAPAKPDPVINEAMNLSFARLPIGFTVTENSDSTLELGPTDPEQSSGPTAMWVEVGEPSDFGIPLVDIVNSQKDQYEALEGGTFAGNRELGTHVGKAYYSRGGYTFEGAAVEETRIFLVHPTENRLVTFHYRYPSGDDSGARIQELFTWLGELSAIVAQAPEPTPETQETQENK